MTLFRVSVLCLGLSLVDATCSGAAAGGEEAIRYLNQPDEAYDEFVRDQEGKVKWVEYIMESKQEREGFQDGSVSTLHNCSDAAQICVIGDHVVFAVPRTGLTPHSIYTAAGAYLRVEKCLREQAGRCDRALVSSDCRWLLTPDGCTDAPADSRANEYRGQISYFIFEQGKGVTSYGNDVELAKRPHRQLAIAQHYKLQGPRGLLAEGALMPDR